MRLFFADVGRLSITWLANLLLIPVIISFCFGAYVVADLLLDKNHYSFGELFLAAFLAVIGSAIVLGFQAGICLVPTFPLQVLAILIIDDKSSFLRTMLSFFMMLVASALTALLYDYAVPSFRWYTDSAPDWKHGLTLYRFLVAFLVQTGIFLTNLVLPFVIQIVRKLRSRRDRGAV